MRKGRILPAFAFTPPHLVEEVSGTGLLFSDGISRAATTEKVFEQLAQRSDEVLIKIQSIFPFDLFPDYVAVDKNKVTVVNRVFFGSGEVRAVPITYIAEVIVEANIFFATLTILDQKYDTQPIIVKHLRKSDALKVQKIIQGLVIADTKKVNVTQLDNTELVQKAEKMGKAHHSL